MSDDDELRNALRRRADDVAPTSSGLSEVTARARVIRRRRRAGVTAAAVVVVAAIAVPVGLGLGDHDRVTPSEPQPSHTVAPSPTPSTTPSSGPARQATLGGIRRGADPKVTYAEGGVVHGPGGVQRLPLSSADVFASYRGGWVVGTRGAAPTITQYGADGKVIGQHPGSGPVVSDDGTRVAWWWQDGANGAGHLYSGAGSTMGEAGAAARPTPVGTKVVVNGFGPGGSLFYSTDDVSETNAQVWQITSAGKAERVKDMLHLDGLAEGAGLVVGSQSGSNGGCPTVLRWPSLGTVHPICQGEFVSLSPDGKHAVTTDVARAWREVRIVDAPTAGEVGRFSPPAPLVWGAAEQAVWEPDGKGVLIDVVDPSRRECALIRVDLHGGATRTTDVVRCDPNAEPFGFERTFQAAPFS